MVVLVDDLDLASINLYCLVLFYHACKSLLCFGRHFYTINKIPFAKLCQCVLGNLQ